MEQLRMLARKARTNKSVFILWKPLIDVYAAVVYTELSRHNPIEPNQESIIYFLV